MFLESYQTILYQKICIPLVSSHFCFSSLSWLLSFISFLSVWYVFVSDWSRSCWFCYWYWVSIFEMYCRIWMKFGRAETSWVVQLFMMRLRCRLMEGWDELELSWDMLWGNLSFSPLYPTDPTIYGTDLPRWGIWPVTSSHKITPKLYTSADSVYFSPRKISGAIQCGVPTLPWFSRTNFSL